MQLPVLLPVVALVFLVDALEQPLEIVGAELDALLLPLLAEGLLERLDGQQVHPGGLPLRVLQQRDWQLRALEHHRERVRDALRNRLPEGLHLVLRDDPRVPEPPPVRLNADGARGLLFHLLYVRPLGVHVEALDGALGTVEAALLPHPALAARGGAARPRRGGGLREGGALRQRALALLVAPVGGAAMAAALTGLTPRLRVLRHAGELRARPRAAKAARLRATKATGRSGGGRL
mmetsp:Transcript_87538/g.245048  ORF Transcript_87538/g.245048 Transcript_87538/m.245048 type:complete len:235 (+) Transcript_87538:1281-1985(+)